MDYSAEVRQRFAAACAGAQRMPEVPDAVWGEAGDRALNVWVRFQVQFDAGTVGAMRFEVFGCPHTVAAADYLAEQLPGRPVAELTDWDVQELATRLRIPVEKLGKLLVLQDALAACRNAWTEKVSTGGVSADGDDLSAGVHPARC